MPIRCLAPIPLLLLATACQSTPEPPQDKAQSQHPPSVPRAQVDERRFTDVPSAKGFPAPPAMMALEVRLDRLGFSSGVIDGRPTRFDRDALRGFQAATGLTESGELDAATKRALAAKGDMAATRIIRIPEAFARQPLVPDLPEQTSKQGGYDRLGYRTLVEALAERFHTTPETLAALNPSPLRLAPGATVQVPNIAEVQDTLPATDERGWNETLLSLGVSPRQPTAETIVVSKSKATLRAYDAADRLLVQFPATMGSAHDPLPLGDWKIQGVSRNPDYRFNPKLFWDVSDAVPARLLKPGPNGPVGVVWIDLSKEHYGIHGTPEPSLIGRSASHGCVRLTNWDAARLAQMVRPGVAVRFEP